MPKHGLYIRSVTLKRAQALPREVYLVCSCVARSGASHGSSHFQVTTEPVRGVKNSKPLVFDPPLELWPESETAGGLVARVAVMESDEDWRRAGQILDRYREKLAQTDVAARIASGLGFGSVGVASAVLKNAFSLAVSQLQKAGDDVIDEYEIRVETLHDDDDTTFTEDGDRSSLDIFLGSAERERFIVEPVAEADPVTLHQPRKRRSAKRRKRGA